MGRNPSGFFHTLSFPRAAPKPIRKNLFFPGSRRPTFTGSPTTYCKSSVHRYGCNSSRRVLQASSPTPGSSGGALGVIILDLTYLQTKHHRKMRLSWQQKACPSTVGGSPREGVLHCTQQWQGSDPGCKERPALPPAASNAAAG
jgi:hypothetical protein